MGICVGVRGQRGGRERKKRAEETINCREECEEDIQNIQPWNPEDRSVFPEMCNEERQLMLDSRPSCWFTVFNQQTTFYDAITPLQMETQLHY